jgi:hypothetical protein
MAQRTQRIRLPSYEPRSQCGADKDSDRASLGHTFAKRAGYWLAGEFYYAAVSATDHIEALEVFAQMLQAIAGNDVRTIPDGRRSFPQRPHGKKAPRAQDR